MKNKTVIAIILFIAGSFLSGYFGPWWAPAAFILLGAALMGLSVSQAILSGSISLSLVYLGMAIWMSRMDKADIIQKTGELMGGLSPVMMILVTTIVGAITGLLSGWLGSALGYLLPKK